LSDEELLESLHTSSYSDVSWEEFLEAVVDREKPDTITPLLQQLFTQLQSLESTVSSTISPANTGQLVARCNGIESLSANVSKVKPPVVKVDAPVVNVPAPVVTIEAPIINIPKADPVIIHTPKQWEFKVNRDRNGFIQSVTATEVLDV